MKSSEEEIAVPSWRRTQGPFNPFACQSSIAGDELVAFLVSRPCNLRDQCIVLFAEVGHFVLVHPRESRFFGGSGFEGDDLRFEQRRFFAGSTTDTPTSLTISHFGLFSVNHIMLNYFSGSL
jgi:hypothetical protein